MNTCNAKRPCFITTTRPPPSTGHTTTLAHTLAHTMAARQEQVCSAVQLLFLCADVTGGWCMPCCVCCSLSLQHTYMCCGRMLAHSAV